MAIITSGKTFANGEQLSADKLNQVITAATFNQADAVDGSTMTLIGGAMAVADEGIVTGKIAPGAVNFSKLTDVLDEDNMSSDSATSLATQQSIKAYTDSLIGTADRSTASGLVTEGDQGSITLGAGLIVKFGSVNHTSAQTAFTFKDSSGSLSPFPNGIYGVNATVNESVSNSSETCSVFSLNVDGFSIAGYRGVSGDAVGRVFFVAYGY